MIMVEPPMAARFANWRDGRRYCAASAASPSTCTTRRIWTNSGP
ncbi:hypothetical protein I553_5067 [Mycobacterium xenopi 4042]|uniref:Uncharacterized protein n=1 Tax=Mycobacterium xenopi 4042 TaxID=1299334 RepID=X7ZV63_MYCXE|nr:hypothetical protein I553_5067 [Mycobacterium xenopi 4042]